MANYLKLFNSVAEQDTFRAGSDYIEPHVSCIEDGTSVKYNKTTWEVLFSGSDIAISGSQTTYSYHNTDGVNYSGEFYDKGTAGFNDYPIS